jgi:hypothetical protein
MDRMTPKTREHLICYAYGFFTGLLVHILAVFVLKTMGDFLGYAPSAACNQAGQTWQAIGYGLLGALFIYGPLGLLAGSRADRVKLPTGFSANPRLNAAITISAVFALLFGALQGLLAFNACYLAG